ncbi:MAG: hypothetical protein R6V57_03690 [Vicinamibacterales bacterium]
MRAPWRPAVAAAVLNLIVVAAGAAQTVIVTKAPPGSAIELVVNSAVAATATADATGLATMAVTTEARGGKTESDTYVFVEYCDNLRRVILIEPGMQGYPGGQCLRREVQGAYVLRQTTSLVVNVSEPAPSVLVRQGRVPPAWLSDEVEQAESAKPANAPSRGLYGFAAGGLSSFRDAAAFACGADTCDGSAQPLTFSAGVTFWLTPYFGIEGSYLKPGEVRFDGGMATLYDFTSALDTDLFTMVGKAGLPLSRVRIYGFGGATFSRAHWDTLETIDDQTVFVDGVETTIKGGAQGLDLHTQGWGWIAGAGMEVPVSRRVSIFGEGGRAGIKGEDRQSGEGKVDDRVFYIVGGIRVRILG